MGKPVRGNPSNPVVCVCNQINRDVIVGAIRRGCNSIARIGNATTAGAGQCGGTCRPEIEKLIADNAGSKLDPAQKKS